MRAGRLQQNVTFAPYLEIEKSTAQNSRYACNECSYYRHDIQKGHHSLQCVFPTVRAAVTRDLVIYFEMLRAKSLELGLESSELTKKAAIASHKAPSFLMLQLQDVSESGLSGENVLTPDRSIAPYKTYNLQEKRMKR